MKRENIVARVRPHQPALRFAASVILVPILLWFVGWLLVGDEILIVRWGAYAAPWLGLLCLPAVCLFLLGQRIWLAAATLALTAAIWIPILPSLNPARLLKSPPSSGLRVMTFNTSDLNADYGAVATIIAHEKPDIVFLQQIRDLAALKSALSSVPGHLAYLPFPIRTADTVILSRYPLSDGKAFDRRTEAVVTIGHCRIRLWNLHAPHGHLAVRDQAVFLSEVSQDLDRENLPIIAGGDLNSTEYNSVQAPLRDRLRDAYADAGFGFGFTFPSRVRRIGAFGRLARIDHLFYRGVGEATRAVVLDNSANSDHFPLVVTFGDKYFCPES